MEAYIRLGLILIAAVVIGAILFNLLFRRNPTQMAKALPGQDAHGNEDTQPSSQGALFTTQQSEYIPFGTTLEETIEEPVALIKETAKDLTKNLLVLYVVAKPGNYFASYDLLQTISAAGLQFGDMNIFHYYLPTETGDVKLFSLASATEPGEFDLNNIGDFSCVGLTLFMNIREVPNVRQAFNKMLETAEQLADDLDGELRAGPHVPWSKERFHEYQEKVL